jgi:ABC-2 type transport system ATP-binding protein
LLEVRDLRKKFGELTAVDGISFDVREGEIFGLLGPNGAGKTTTISMICSLLPPDAGSIKVDGIALEANPREVKRRIGAVPQETAIYMELSARENLQFWGGIYGMSGPSLKQRIDELLQQVGLSDRAKEPVKNFSGGMKRRLNLAMGMIHDPKLLLLDEPTVGIDPQARVNILEIVRNVVKSGRTVLYTTHYLEEAEDLCNRLAIMDHGRLLVQGSIPELKKHLGEGTLLTLTGRFTEAGLRQAISSIDGLVPIEVQDQRAMLSVRRDGKGVTHALEKLFEQHLELDDVSIKEPNLEDLFLKLTGRELRD